MGPWSPQSTRTSSDPWYDMKCVLRTACQSVEFWPLPDDEARDGVRGEAEKNLSATRNLLHTSGLQRGKLCTSFSHCEFKPFKNGTILDFRFGRVLADEFTITLEVGDDRPAPRRASKLGNLVRGR